MAVGLAAGSGLLGLAASSHAAPAAGDRGSASAKGTVPARLACTGSWKISPSPNVGSNPNNQLSGLAIVSHNDVWAVGTTTNSTPVADTLTEHWDGHRWHIVPSPNVAGASQSVLAAVAAVPHADQLWATGISVTGGVQSTLIEHWNGKHWKVISSPNVGTVGNSLTAVVALSPSDVWATGAWSSGPSSSSALIEHWNGKKWRVASSPSVAGHVNLVGLTSVPGTRKLWASGGTGSGTLTEHLSGSAWSVVPSPNAPSSTGGDVLRAISARAAKNVWAVGQDGTGGNPVLTLTEHWNGTKWNVVTSPDPGSTLSVLYSVAQVPGQKTLWAVGLEGTPSTFQTLVERWNGTKWKVVTSPNASTQQDLLQAVASTGSQAWAVGSSTTGAGVTSTLIEHYCLPSQAGPEPPHGWSTVFRDGFTGRAGSRVDRAWVYDTGTHYHGTGCTAAWGTGEVESNSRSTANVRLDGRGHLLIRPVKSGGRWTSGRIETASKKFAAPAGGKLEVTASIRQPGPASGRGYWPAFWMLGAGFRSAGAGTTGTMHCSRWPAVGEIDVMEDVNALSEHSGTLHCGSAPGGPCDEFTGQSSGLRPCPRCQSGYHTYSVIIDRTNPSDESITWYLDGTAYYTVSESQIGTTAWKAAVDHGFFLILDVAMGGAFPNAVCGCTTPTRATSSGAPMRVDNVTVRAWNP